MRRDVRSAASGCTRFLVSALGRCTKKEVRGAESFFAYVHAQLQRHLCGQSYRALQAAIVRRPRLIWRLLRLCRCCTSTSRRLDSTAGRSGWSGWYLCEFNAFSVRRRWRTAMHMGGCASRPHSQVGRFRGVAHTRPSVRHRRGCMHIR